MREPERIDRITNKLNELWKSRPDWRLGQLICNLNFPFRLNETQIFFREDTEWEKDIDKCLK